MQNLNQSLLKCGPVSCCSSLSAKALFVLLFIVFVMSSAGGSPHVSNRSLGQENSSSGFSGPHPSPAISPPVEFIVPCSKEGFAGSVNLSLLSFKPETAALFKQLFDRPSPRFRLIVLLDNGADLHLRLSDSATQAETSLFLIEQVQNIGKFQFLETPTVSSHERFEKLHFCFDFVSLIDCPVSAVDPQLGTLKFSLVNLKDIHFSFVPFENSITPDQYRQLLDELTAKVFSQTPTYRIGNRWTKKGLLGLPTPTPTQKGFYLDFPHPIPHSLLGKIDMLPNELRNSSLKLELISTVAIKPKKSWAQISAEGHARASSSNSSSIPSAPKTAPLPPSAHAKKKNPPLPSLPLSSNAKQSNTTPFSPSQPKSRIPPPNTPTVIPSLFDLVENSEAQSSAPQEGHQAPPALEKSASSKSQESAASTPSRTLPDSVSGTNVKISAAVTPLNDRESGSNRKKRTRSTGNSMELSSPTTATPPLKHPAMPNNPLDDDDDVILHADEATQQIQEDDPQFN